MLSSRTEPRATTRMSHQGHSSSPLLGGCSRVRQLGAGGVHVRNDVARRCLLTSPQMHPNQGGVPGCFALWWWWWPMGRWAEVGSSGGCSRMHALCMWGHPMWCMWGHPVCYDVGSGLWILDIALYQHKLSEGESMRDSGFAPITPTCYCHSSGCLLLLPCAHTCAATTTPAGGGGGGATPLIIQGLQYRICVGEVGGGQ